MYWDLFKDILYRLCFEVSLTYWGIWKGDIKVFNVNDKPSLTVNFLPEGLLTWPSSKRSVEEHPPPVSGKLLLSFRSPGFPDSPWEKSCFFLFKQHFFTINNILKQFWVRYGKGQVLNFKNISLWIFFEVYSISYELPKTDVPRVAISAEMGFHHCKYNYITVGLNRRQCLSREKIATMLSCTRIPHARAKSSLYVYGSKFWLSWCLTAYLLGSAMLSDKHILYKTAHAVINFSTNSGE